MIQCQSCPFFHREPTGRISFTCDPFSTIVEPECLNKWQLIKLDQMVQAYGATVEFYRKLAPMQEKMFKAMERELDDLNEGEKWKSSDEDDDEDIDRTPNDADWDQRNP
jgi:hypothetical protein